MVVCIPAMAERDFLPETLQSLAECPLPDLLSTLVVVVVNCRVDSGPEVRQDNVAVLDWLRAKGARLIPRLSWVDATSPGFELPAKTGVGLARRMGADSALHELAASEQGELDSILLAHLDADTTVQPDYLSVLRSQGPGRYALAVDFVHQRTDSPNRQCAIDRYELYLRYLVQGLRLSGSPYGFHTVGSAMASTVDCYIAAGGVAGKRQAGEDFYFLQECAKVGRVCTVSETSVFPSARASDRVPFGTGPRIAAAMGCEGRGLKAPDPAAFRELRVLFAGFADACRGHAVSALGCVPEDLHAQLTEAGLPEVWRRLSERCQSSDMLLVELHRWFDALKTIRFVRERGERIRSPVEVEAAWCRLLEMAGMPAVGKRDAASLVSQARNEQRRHDCRGLVVKPCPGNMLPL